MSRGAWSSSARRRRRRRRASGPHSIPFRSRPQLHLPSQTRESCASGSSPNLKCAGVDEQGDKIVQKLYELKEETNGQQDHAGTEAEQH